MICYSFNIMITNKLRSIKENKKSPLLAKIKFEPTFFQVLWRFAFSLPLQGEAGGKGVRGEFRPLQGEAGGKGVRGEFRPPSPLMKSVRIFSNTHRQLEKERFGSPSARARQPILGAKLNFLSFCFAKQNGQKRAFLN